MISISEIIKRSEFKITSIFGFIALFIVVFFGIIKKIDFIIIVKRILISELFFIPMGFVIGYVLKQVLPNIYGKKEIKTEEELQEEQQEMFSSESEKTGATEGEKEFDVSDTVVEEQKESRKSKDTVSDIQPVEVQPPKSNVYDKYKKIKKVQKTALGDHIIINDTKLANDPKLMAEAVRTMMNKEE